MTLDMPILEPHNNVRLLKETLSQVQTMFLVDDGQQQALGINFHMFNGKEKKIS
jgi:hypothetical protein